MAQNIEQTLTQMQAQQLSGMQVVLAGLVELPVTDLAERVRNEMMDNAALEEADGSAGGGSDDSSESSNEEAGTDRDWGEETTADIHDSLGDYMSEDDVPAYLQARADEARERHEIPLTGGTSAYDDLMRQIGEHDLTEHERYVLNYIIGSLDEDGFLRKDLLTLSDELAIYNNIETDVTELEHLLAVLQRFEPRGIGARSLQECLRLQVEDADFRSPYKHQALDVLEHCFKDFTSKRWDLIAQRLDFDEDTTGHVRHLLTHLNPRPGSLLGSGTLTSAPTVIPDFYVSLDRDGLPLIELNQGDIPELRVSSAFKDSIRQYGGQRGNLSREQHDVYLYAKQKVESAMTFINLLSRRRETLMAVMQAIADIQQAFFTGDDDETLLRPMALREVAARAGVDISTVSRVTGSKYVQTDYGIYPLRFFFSSQFTTEAGDEVSARKVRAAIQEIIDNEDKAQPLSDEAIAILLKEQNLPVARRTVAKYREQMGILTARLRRKR